MSSVDLKQIKHDLRTPINHLVGYSELALESAVDDEDLVAEPTLRRLVEMSRSVAIHADKVFSEANYETAEDLLQRFQQMLTPQLKSIVSLASQSEQASPASAYANDLQRICSAATRLQKVDIQIRSHEAAGPSERSQSSLRERILVVDDDADNRDLLTRMLWTDGYRYVTASSGMEALDLLGRESIDLVLLDIMMPGMTGHQVFEQMRHDPRLSMVPVIMISALSELIEVVQCIRAGAEDYVQKPFQPVVLRARIEASLAKKRLQRQLSAQERLASLGALSAAVAHEITNPLNVVVNFAELSLSLIDDLADQTAGAGTFPDLDLLRGNTDTILQHARRADNIIKSMLFHSRNGAACKERVDLNKLLIESVALARHGERDKTAVEKVRIEFMPNSSLSPVNVYPADLQRAFVNLISNALQACAVSDHAAVIITAEQTTESVEITIRANGPGSSPEIRERVFEPFFTTKDPDKGGGLGLSITNEIISNLHQGQITVNSEAGVYTAFIIRLPNL